jgi:hypothetical protein
MSNSEKEKRSGICKTSNCKCKCKRKKEEFLKIIPKEEEVKVETDYSKVIDSLKDFSHTDDDYSKNCMENILKNQNLTFDKTDLNTNEIYSKQLDLMEQSFSKGFLTLQNSQKFQTDNRLLSPNNLNIGNISFSKTERDENEAKIHNQSNIYQSKFGKEIRDNQEIEKRNFESLEDINNPNTVIEEANAIINNKEIKTIEILSDSKEKVDLIIEKKDTVGLEDKTNPNIDIEEANAAIDNTGIKTSGTLTDSKEKFDLITEKKSTESKNIESSEDINNSNTIIEGANLDNKEIKSIETLSESKENVDLIERKNTESLEDTNNQHTVIEEANEIIDNKGVKTSKTLTDSKEKFELITEEKNSISQVITLDPNENLVVTREINEEKQLEKIEDKFEENKTEISKFSSVINNDDVILEHNNRNSIIENRTVQNGSTDKRKETKGSLTDLIGLNPENKDIEEKHFENEQTKTSFEINEQNLNLRDYKKFSIRSSKTFIEAPRKTELESKTSAIPSLKVESHNNQNELTEESLKNFNPKEKALTDLSKEFRLIIIPPAKLNNTEANNHYVLNIELNKKVENENQINQYRCEMDLMFKITANE